ncbi:oligoribonuclease [Pseudomarimonas arenosa]|uniref:Oligoribonuclease n=1 Tax=Pseudomarimonas arenosa TaxID=2774145 RepID=A0AAW3ZHN8_9GAMM|nr:oligoribonuclease [Pseudomarimonas arenosa]MBD8525308.1 oligoribonuclease [Pseudomarimonas arenosa]
MSEAAKPASTDPATPAAVRWVWIDLEMTGLDPDKDTILEIACLVTDADLQVLAEGPELAIQTSLQRLEGMDDWNRNQHSKSGLWQRALESLVTLAEAEQQTLDFLAQWVAPGVSPLCGNTIYQDRRFLNRWMPRLDDYFHYRLLDVSTLKLLAKQWAPEVASGMVKQSAHTALADIRESVEELRYYRKFMGQLAGPSASA